MTVVETDDALGESVTGDDPVNSSAPTPLLAPAEGVPDVVEDERALDAAAAALRGGHGPVAIDAERASGHRYGQRAYLVQLRREGAGTWLVDPIMCPDLAPIADALTDVEWVLHAATQDLGCLAEVGLRPAALFDTELAGRLVGLPRVGLGAAVEHYLGLSLAKEHSAVDWSRRPLPEPWLRYAALDVEVLVQLRDALEADLRQQDKWEWARQEFEALLSFSGPPARTDPWRRTSGMHRIRRRRTIAVVRELWLARDRLAQRRDISPGRVLSDGVLIALASDPPRDTQALSQVRELRPALRSARVWLDAIETAMSLPESALPPITLPSTGPPPPRVWAERDPVAAARLTASRTALTTYAEERHLPVENLISPDAVRRVLWDPPETLDEAGFADAIRGLGAREWQVTIVAPILAEACDPAE